MNNETTVTAATQSFRWKWVIIGVVVGAIVMAIIVGVAASGFRNLFIPSLIACTGFVVTGIVVGYYSPGVTLREASVGGVFLAALLFTALMTFFDQPMSVMQMLVTLAFGYLLSLVGGWVGESLQQNRAEELKGMQWRWVFVGVVVSVVLNSLGVFGLAPMFRYDLTPIFVTFLVTFVLAGYVVGYFSPGVTIKEASLAGLLTIVVDWALVYFGLEISVPVANMLFAMSAGFLLSMLGAWVGERLQASMERKESE